MQLRHRVVVYVTRPTPTSPSGDEVLVFEQADRPILQVPAGGVEPGESIEAAAVREVFEETGITVTPPPRRLTSTLHRYSAVECWCVQDYVQVDAPSDLPDEWEHVVTGEGVERGRRFLCRWLPTKLLDHVIGGQGNAAHLLQAAHAPTKPTAAVVRLAAEADVRDIRLLRNHYVDVSTAIYTDLRWTPEDALRWFELRDASKHPVTVAEVDGHFAGYGSLSPFDTKCGYAGTAENSVYIAPDHHRLGIGAALLRDLLDRARTADLHTIVARIDTGQSASLGLHFRHGFAPVGILREAGHKFGAWRDVAYLQKLL